VSGVRHRAAGFFLAPPPPPRRESATLPPAARAVVLGAVKDVVPLAAAVALSLRAATRAPAALAAVWDPESDETRARHDVATRRASRLAGRLIAHDLPATVRGRVAWLALPTDPVPAATAVRAASAIVDGPLVTALPGARPAVLDDLVAEHDLAIVAADPESPLARAALAALAGRGIAAKACAPLGRGLARKLALAGLAAPRLDVSGLAAARIEVSRLAAVNPGDESRPPPPHES
jgi:hypothetical protein